MKMFETESKEYADKYENNRGSLEWWSLRNSYQVGAAFGYDKAIKELETANEWHYNGVPENENDVLCQIDKDIFVVGYFHQKNKQYYSTSGEWLETVIAWKEITLPKEIEQ